MAESKKIKKIAVLTSGGDAPGMNAAIRAVVRKSIVNASLPATASLLQQIANGERNGLCDSLVASCRWMQTVSFCVAEIPIVRARDGIKP